MAPDGRMFQQGGRKGELYDLKQGLNATTMKERKTALKRTVAAMTLGKDVSSLFTDVVKNTAGDISMKKLVYLYIINYAQSNPDLSILIVNTFIKDANDHNPLIRALAIRTMALIPLDKITEYLCDPLHAALKDADPYVRKTAAVGVAKLYDSNPELAVQEGFIDELQQLLSDGNPMTVSNAVAALSEIAESSHTPDLLSLTPTTVRRFLSALSECTEWGQIFILDAIAPYRPMDAEEADLMVERIVPRLQHANAAVVLAAVRTIVNLMPLLDSDDKRNFLVNKMSAPLVTLLTSPPEMQFVVLRNIDILVREYPTLLSGDVKVFFASYADPLYVKNEKLDILVRLTDETNADVVLAELVEYAGEVDMNFARKAVDCIARIALRLPQISGKCVDVLSELLNRKVAHLTEQVVIALKDIFREYPRQFDHIVSNLCECADEIDDPAARAALVWIIGEHADRIPSAVSMLRVVSETIHEEVPSVQLQILTACVKAYLLCGSGAEAVMNVVLKYATEEAENIDVRDRGCIYVRLVSMGPEPAQKVILSNKEGISDSHAEMPVEPRKELLRSLSSIASVYHKPAKMFEGARRKVPVGNPLSEAMAEEDLLGLEHNVEEPSDSSTALAITDGTAVTTAPVGDAILDDILGATSLPAAPAAPSTAQPGSDLLSDLGMGGLQIGGIGMSTRAAVSSPKKELLTAERGNGLCIKGGLIRSETGSIALDMELSNTERAQMTDFAIQFNKNIFGFVPAAQMNISTPLVPSSPRQCQLPLGTGGEADLGKGLVVQVAVKFTPGGVVYFAIDASDDIGVVLDRNSGPLQKPIYLSTWQSVPDSCEVRASLTVAPDAAQSVEWISKKLKSAGVFVVAKRMSAKPPVIYLSATLVGPSKVVIMAELTLGGSNGGAIASRATLGEEGAGALVGFNEMCGRLLAR